MINGKVNLKFKQKSLNTMVNPCYSSIVSFLSIFFNDQCLHNIYGRQLKLWYVFFSLYKIKSLDTDTCTS